MGTRIGHFPADRGGNAAPGIGGAGPPAWAGHFHRRSGRGRGERGRPVAGGLHHRARADGRVEEGPQAPHLRPDPGVDGRPVRPVIGEVVPLEHQPGGEARPVTHRAARLDLGRPLVLREHLGGDGQRPARLHEVAVLHVPGRPQHDDGVGEVFPEADRPGRSLGHRLEHEHSRQDGEPGEMVGQILFGQRHRLDRRDALARLDGDHPVEKRESHGASFRRAAV